MAQDPDAIQREIERTRAELAATFEAIVDKASPKRVVGRGVDRVKDQLAAAVGTVNAKLGRSDDSSEADSPERGARSGSGPLLALRGAGAGRLSVGGRELRKDRVAIAASAVAVLGWLLLRRRGRGR